MIRKELVKNITDLRRDPIALFRLAKRKSEPLYVFNRAQPIGVLLSWEEYEKILQKLENYYDALEVKAARETSDELIPWKKARKALLKDNV